MKVQVLYFTGCPNHGPTVQRVREIVRRLDIDAQISEVAVTAHDDPAAMAFIGSPTVLVDGRDIDPAQRQSPDYAFGCHTYNGQGVPPAAMIEAALREAAAQAVSEPAARGGSYPPSPHSGGAGEGRG